MTQEDWTKMNKESHYNSLIKQDLANRKLIKKLQLERDELKKQLKLYGVVWRSGQLNIAEHQESVIKSLNDLKKRYPNKTDYRIASNCGTIQYFVDNELVYEVNI